MGEIHKYPDLSGFIYPINEGKFEDRNLFYGYDEHTGWFGVALSDENGRTFEAIGSFGWRNYTPGEPQQYEPHVLSIDEVVVNPRGAGLGSAVLIALMSAATGRGIHVARSDIVNPYVVKMIERLRTEGYILQVYYRADDNPLPHATPLSDEFTHLPSMSADDAYAFLVEVDRNPEGATGTVDVLWYF